MDDINRMYKKYTMEAKMLKSFLVILSLSVSVCASTFEIIKAEKVALIHSKSTALTYAQNLEEGKKYFKDISFPVILIVGEESKIVARVKGKLVTIMGINYFEALSPEDILKRATEEKGGDLIINGNTLQVDNSLEPLSLSLTNGGRLHIDRRDIFRVILLKIENEAGEGAINIIKYDDFKKGYQIPPLFLVGLEKKYISATYVNRKNLSNIGPVTVAKWSEKIPLK